MAQACNPWADEVDTGGSLGAHQQPSLLEEFQANESERSCFQKQSGQCLKNVINVVLWFSDALTYTCTHMLTLMYTYTVHIAQKYGRNN